MKLHVKKPDILHTTHSIGNSTTSVPFPVTQSLCTQLQTKSTWDPHSEPSPLFMYTQTEITLCVARRMGTKKAFKMIYCKWFSTLLAKIISPRPDCCSKFDILLLRFFPSPHTDEKIIICNPLLVH